METIKIFHAIQDRMRSLAKGREELKSRGEIKAAAIMEYEKKLALSMLKLKNNKIDSWEGERVGNLPVTLIGKVAKGMCWNEKIEMEKADSAYKAAIIGMQALQAELSALQSCSKYFEEL